MTIYDCDKCHKDEMCAMMEKLKHPNIYGAFLALWQLMPYMPVPSVNYGNPTFFDWGGFFQMTVGYEGVMTYQRYTFFMWQEITQEEFVEQIKINWSLP